MSIDINFGHSGLEFDRDHYIEHMYLFESGMLEDAEHELCEFNYDAEELAFELAYTRARLVFLESKISELELSEKAA